MMPMIAPVAPVIATMRRFRGGAATTAAFGGTLVARGSGLAGLDSPNMALMWMWTNLADRNLAVYTHVEVGDCDVSMLQKL